MYGGCVRQESEGEKADRHGIDLPGSNLPSSEHALGNTLLYVRGVMTEPDFLDSFQIAILLDQKSGPIHMGCRILCQSTSYCVGDQPRVLQALFNIAGFYKLELMFRS